MATLADSLVLHAVGEGAWRAHADPQSEAGTGMFGGWTAAMLLKTILSDARAQGEPVALNVSYVSRIAPGAELQLRAQQLGGSRSVSTWRSDIRIAGEAVASASANAVLAVRRPSDGFTEFTMPQAPDPNSLPMLHPPGPFGQRIDMRAWKVPFGQKDSHSSQWIRERSGHPIDHVLLAYFSDCYAPRIFLRGNSFRPSSTVTLSVYFYASPEELAASANDYFLLEAVGTRAESSVVGAQLRIWNQSGALLATSEQLCWFK